MHQLVADYEHEATEWRRWVEKMIDLVDDRLLIGSADSLIDELQRFKEEDMPPRATDLSRLLEIYAELERRLPPGTAFASEPLQPGPMKRLWSDLCDAVERREQLLLQRRATQVMVV